MIASGRLNERVTLLDPQSVLDEAGQADTSARPVWTVWAEVRQQASTEDLDNGQTTAKVTYTVTIRYRDDIREHWQLQRACGTTLHISSIIERGRREELVIQAHEER